MNKSPDLAPWLGLPVTLTFTAKEDGSAQTSFVIDDVEASDCNLVSYLGRNMASIGLLNSAAMVKANERLGS